MSEYKRLTRYSGKVMQEDCRNCNYAYNNVCNYKDKENKIIYDIDEDCKKVMLNRLAELEDKIMDGTLVVLSREEYQELEDLRINHAKDLINANKSYEEHIKDIKLEYSNNIKNLEEIIDRQSKDLNSQANRLIDLKEELENKGKETAEEFYSEMYDFAYRTKSYYTDALNDIIAKIDETFNDFRIELESLLRKYGVEVE